MARRSKRTRKNKKTKRILNVTQKAALTAGSLSAIAFAPAVAQAGVVTVTGSPVSISMSDAAGTTASWDVDGAHGNDFELFRTDSEGNAIHLASQFPGYGEDVVATVASVYGGLNGRGLVGPTWFTDNVQALHASFSVGPTLANSYVWGDGSVSGYRYRNAMGTEGGQPGGPTYYIGYDFDQGFNEGDNFFGFRFEDANSALHYGWANINFDTTNGVVTITKWAYETDPDTAIHIPDAGGKIVPLPGAHALGLLGLGAAGLARWRKHRKETAKADA